MKLNEFLQTMNEVKKQKPMFDYNQFDVMIDGKDVTKFGVDLSGYKILLDTTTGEENVVEESDKREV